MSCRYFEVSGKLNIMKKKEILNSEMYRIISQFNNLYEQLVGNDELKEGILDFQDPLRTSTQLFENRRGLKISSLTTENVDIIELLNSILADDTIKTIESLWSEKGRNHYSIAIYGKPDRISEWGFSIDGPFLSLNFTFKNEDFSAVPMLIGNFKPESSNGEVKNNPMITEIGIPSDFMSMLDEKQMESTLISSSPPDDLIYSYSENLLIIPSGMPLNQINTKDQKFFFGMILSVYLNRLKPNMAKSFNSKFFSEPANKYKLAWKGGLKMDDRFYYSISSTNMIIEFIKLNEGDSDIITVMREKNYDFGYKLLNQ